MTRKLRYLEPERESAQCGARSSLVNRNVTVAGRRTSVRLEPDMWEALRHICQREKHSLNDLITAVDQGRTSSSLTAALRVYLLKYFLAAATEEGHRRAGHGDAMRPYVSPSSLPINRRYRPRARAPSPPARHY